MNILVLGGTRFVGRHIVEQVLARGHRVSIFTRGKSEDDLPPSVERLRGDRDAGDLSALAGRQWDACVDVSGYLPRVVEQSAERLKDAVKRYLFISTVSVYAGAQGGPISEDATLQSLENPHSEDVRADYGALKAVCEAAVRRLYAERATIVRPGLVAGPFDPTGRFTYWVLRAARGGAALAPGDGQDLTAVIDARDLAAFVVRLLEEDVGGIFNAVGEPKPFAAFLAEVSAGVSAQPQWRWLPQAEQQRLGAGDIWPVYAHREPLLGIQPLRALSAGLTLRPLSETAQGTLEWAVAVGAHGAGPSAAREAALLAQLM